ncbi:transaldolase [Gemmatimonadetes bacterium T265]|nr:transaldolase [Gemmatimonadetes bacterium T265]
MPNRLEQLHAAGQSIWLDFIDRRILQDGSLQRRIDNDALTGMTSNPTIFQNALAEGEAYDESLHAAKHGLTPWQLFETIEVEDVKRACEIFRPVYDATSGRDGFVSIEVSPGVANDPDATIEEGRRLWAHVDHPNVMIKVPGTESGARAVRSLLAEGVNVNVTLLFSLDAYRRVIDAYLDALEERVAKGAPIDRIGGVASFFVSRVDTEVDKRLDALAPTLPEDRRAHALALRGKAAIANAKLAYKLFQEKFSGPRWEALAAKGAGVQRPLWASTGTKNPAYRDVLYVEQLIGPDTVNTLPPATIDAFRDHGETAVTVDKDVDQAERDLADLAALGIDINPVTDKLLAEGISSFQKSFDGLLANIEKRMGALAATA